MSAVFHKKTTLLIATAALALTGPAHAQVIFNASFNDQPLGPLATGSPPDLPQSIITDTGATVEVVASAGDLTDQPVVLHSVPGSLACAAFYSPSVLIAGDWRLSWDSLVLDTPADDPPEQAHVLLGGGTETMWGIKYLPNGQFSVEDAGGFHSVGSFAVGRSSHFDLDLHLDRSTYELSVNNQSLLSGGLKASRQFDLTYFRSNGRTGSQLPLMAFDNVQVQSAPAIA
ncbi:MAG TPA: hypothetical protein VNM37_21040, partial [Candidatus Dormibacteraeota bacterium]|nr:hypothetical protein [Candidatus Dormibacteraeota bacterium]